MPARWWLWFRLMLLLNFLIVSYLFPGPEAPVEVPYTLFREQVEAGNVEEISSRGDAIEGTFEEAVTYPPEGETRSRTSTRFDTALPSFTDPGLEQLLLDQGVEINSEPLEQPRRLWQTVLLGFGPALLLIVLFVWLWRRGAGRWRPRGRPLKLR
jgi:cell division protease FtsH